MIASAGGFGGGVGDDGDTVVRLRDEILSGVFPPDARLNEVQIAVSLGISRTKLREALHQLAMEGLVERIANRGTFVTRIGSRDLLELYEVREALETMSARLAAERATEAQITGLRDLLAETQGILETGRPVPYPRDLDLHAAILQIAGNSRLIQKAREVHFQVALARSRSAYRPARARKAFAEHVGIVEAIEAGDPDLADARMRAHLEASLKHVQAVFELRATALENAPSDQPGDRDQDEEVA